MQKEVGNYIKITGASFGKDRQMSGEMTKMGVNKATGMQRLMDELKIGRKIPLLLVMDQMMWKCCNLQEQEWQWEMRFRQ